MEKVSSNVDSNYTSIPLWQDESESLSTTKKDYLSINIFNQIEKEKLSSDFHVEESISLQLSNIFPTLNENIFVLSSFKFEACSSLFSVNSLFE